MSVTSDNKEYVEMDNTTEMDKLTDITDGDSDDCFKDEVEEQTVIIKEELKQKISVDVEAGNVSKGTAPINESTGNVSKCTAPTNESTGNVSKGTAPTNESTGNVSKGTAPTNESTGNVSKGTAPTNESTGNVSKGTAPTNESTGNVSKGTAPTNESTGNVSKGTAPTNESREPIDDQDTITLSANNLIGTSYQEFLKMLPGANFVKNTSEGKLFFDDDGQLFVVADGDKSSEINPQTVTVTNSSRQKYEQCIIGSKIDNNSKMDKVCSTAANNDNSSKIAKPSITAANRNENSSNSSKIDVKASNNDFSSDRSETDAKSGNADDDSLKILMENITDDEDRYSSVRKFPRRFHCESCDKKYTSKSSLSFHIQQHHLKEVMGDQADEKSYKCSECDKSFVCNSSLAQHMNLKHLVGNIYKCHFVSCGKSFNTKHDLERHLRTHSGIKPFFCQLCEKSFTCKSSLKFHVKTHGEKKWKCDHCSKEFNIKSDLDRHETKHTGKKTWKCKQCGKAYSCKSAVKFHVKAKHLSHEPEQSYSSSKKVMRVKVEDNILFNGDL